MAGNYLTQTGVFLASAVVAVPICARLGLGSVLGYLLAGVAVGPSAFDLVGNTEQIMHVAEFGVVVMLFLVGLELQPKMLWKLKTPVFGLGGLQMLITTLVLTGVLFALGLNEKSSLALGMTLALSSTAIVLQSLSERGQQKSEAGQNSFAVLLFQDIAVIPILAMLPLLAFHSNDGLMVKQEGFAALSGWLKAIISLGVIAAIVLSAHFLLRPVFRLIASTGVRELFTVTALFIVVGIAVMMSMIELSPALGTFIGGVVLANSEYRHELESDLEPFKGILLGLFFITVGAGINFSLLVSEPLLIPALAAGLMIIKMLVVFIIASLWKVSTPHKYTMSLGLGQGGEFAFVLISVITAHSILSQELASWVTLVVALSMALTPIVFLINDYLIQPRFSKIGEEKEADDPSAGHGKPVVIAGFGRFGQLAGRLLKANGFSASILDLDARSVGILTKHGLEVYYGDAARHDLLETAGCSEAKVLIIAVDDWGKILHIAELARKHFPNLTVIARAKDARHAYALRQIGIENTVCEAEYGGLGLGEQALKALGFGAWRAARATKRFRRHQAETHQLLFKHWGDEKAVLNIQRNRVSDLDQLFESDSSDKALQVDSAWRTGVIEFPEKS